MTRAAKQSPIVVPVKTIRCAIYTRKSSEEGLAQEFNSLDAQREGAEAYIASQKAEGWLCLPDRYDDGGFSGGNLERPAMARLLADIGAGKIDCVVVYKVDRLSRSLMDFARIMTTFDEHHVSFVSVTQHFNTTHSMGRLTLNILLSFAQFEREIIGERIRDKIAAQRRRGKWAGGVPVLGYDVDRSNPSPRLVINAEEAARVRAIFDLYLQRSALLPVVQELASRGWCNKSRTTNGGRAVGGKPFDKCNLHALLTNPIYTGKIRHKTDLYDGEHEAIVAAEVFTKVQAMLQRNGRSGGAEVRNRYGSLLKGLLTCKACGRAMVHTFAGKRSTPAPGKAAKQYRYYTCTHAIKSGARTCPSGSLPAAEIEKVVVDQVRVIADDADLRADVLAKAGEQVESEITALQTQQGDLEREMARHHTEVRKLATTKLLSSRTTARLSDLHNHIQAGERRLLDLASNITGLEADRIDESDVAAAFADFDNIWSQLSPREQACLLALLVARVEYDAKAGTVSVTFHATGIKALAGNSLEHAA